ncbi:MAG: MarR family winged helix-turn-helix transcriptional regulator [Deltaproteobacteria bacterium]
MGNRFGKEVQDNCIAQALRRSARAVSREYDAALAATGLSIGQFSTLAALDRPEPLRLGQLAEGLGMDRTTLNRNLAPLEKKGLVASRSNLDDARARLLSLTELGQRALKSAEPAWRRAQARMAAKIPGWPLIGPALGVLK